MYYYCVSFFVFTTLTPSCLAGSCFCFLARCRDGSLPGAQFEVVASDLLFRSWHPTHHLFIRCVHTCVFTHLGLQATCTAARAGSPCTALRVVGGQVLATLVARRALFLPCLECYWFFPLPMQVLWSMAGLLPPCLLCNLHCTPSGVVILCPPPPPRLLCGCLFCLYMFDCVDSVRPVFCCVSHCCCPGS